jgi:hypothetical protein
VRDPRDRKFKRFAAVSQCVAEVIAVGRVDECMRAEGGLECRADTPGGGENAGRARFGPDVAHRRRQCPQRAECQAVR